MNADSEIKPALCKIDPECDFALVHSDFNETLLYSQHQGISKEIRYPLTALKENYSLNCFHGGYKKRPTKNLLYVFNAVRKENFKLIPLNRR